MCPVLTSVDYVSCVGTLQQQQQQQKLHLANDYPAPMPGAGGDAK